MTPSRNKRVVINIASVGVVFALLAAKVYLDRLSQQMQKRSADAA